MRGFCKRAGARGGTQRHCFGCFFKLGVLFVGVLIIRALLFGVYMGTPDFCKPYVCVPEFGFEAVQDNQTAHDEDLPGQPSS